MTFLVQTTVYLTVTALFVLLFKRIFKSKLSAKWQVYIWALLLIRFCVPFLPQSQLSVFNAVDIPTEYTYTQEMQTVTVLPAEITTTDRIVPNTTVTPAATFDWQTVIVGVWLCGAAALFLYFFAVYCISLYRSKKQAPIRDAATLQLLEACKQTVGVKRNVRLITGENPMLMGWIRPKIVLPDGYTVAEQRSILTHELCHLQSGDIPIIWVAVAVLCLNWFNPILWYAFFTLRRDIEVYCDERVLTYCKDKKEYASLLLKSALAKNKFVLGTTSLQNGEKEVERRIKYMAYFKKPKVIWSIIIAVAAIAVSALCLTNALEEEEPSDLYTRTEQTTAVMLTTPLSIYDCRDAYFHESTPTHGSGSVSVPLDPEKYEIALCTIRLCDDGCDTADVVSRITQGYAPAYRVVHSAEYAVSDGWNYPTQKFTLEAPDEMIADLKRQGVLEEVMSRFERNYYYLLTLDDTHYAFVQITPTDTNTERPADEDAIVNEFVKKAKVNFTTDETEQTPFGAAEATELLRDALITAYENTYTTYEPLYEDPGVTDDATYLRYAIATLAVTEETDRYYKFPVIFEFWVDKYTGEIYKVYNGMVNMMYPFDPYAATALAFAG